jgi:hypothetical protein
MRTLIIAMALVAATLTPTVAQQQLTGTAQFCVQGATGPIKCEYQTMAQCQQALPQGSSDQCVSRSQAQSTVGGPAVRQPAPSPGDQKD